MVHGETGRQEKDKRKCKTDIRYIKLESQQNKKKSKAEAIFKETMAASGHGGSRL